MPSTANVVAFPLQPIIERQQLLDAYFEEAARTSVPAKPKSEAPASARSYSLAPEAKWQIFRAIRADTALSFDAVLVAGYILDWFEQKGGFSAPSAGKMCEAARLFVGKHRKHDHDRLETAILELVQRDWFRVEPFERTPGSGFPGRRFFVTKDRNRP